MFLIRPLNQGSIPDRGERIFSFPDQLWVLARLLFGGYQLSSGQYLGLQSRGQLKCDGTRAETRSPLSAKQTSPFKSAGGRQFSRLLAAEVCASAVVMLDTPCSEVVWRVLATHSIRQFPLHFPSRASPCAITFELESNNFAFYLTFFSRPPLFRVHVIHNADAPPRLFYCV